MYSQNNEDTIAVNYFGDFKGHLLELGANDGRTFSNSLRLIQKGWSADLVEASPGTFKKLQKEHEGNDNVKCHNIAISNVNGTVAFYESETLLGGDDKSLVSTLDKREIERWGGKVKFNEIKVKSITFNMLLDMAKKINFDLISIDIEGLDWIVLKQIDLRKVGCKMLIVETNSKNDMMYISHCATFGMELYAKNQENLIFVKK